MRFMNIGKCFFGIISLCILIFITTFGVRDISNIIHSKSEQQISMMMYLLQVLQLYVGAILSWLVYKLSKTEVNKEEYRKRQDILLGLKYIRHEVNYNMSLVKTLHNQCFNFENLGKEIFKSDAWQKYNIILVDRLDSKGYHKFLGYYTAVSLCDIKELQSDALIIIEDAEGLLEILDNIIKKI
ncbi:hypothetical protein GMB51_10950 [Turicibacter sanguinis]|nr:hypothetical protein [Turicibacter sanguinis]MTN51409.1 hypothetical protein [Turicibacter sanguinis]MTN54602.1 hypothetical protein [Turicibacter sanguinis]MTN57735.1 hypothetical protein [Turicibacter sanguinis]MTN60755.1 hypothetical protein [Turicibacter sanguinis]